MCKIVQHVIHDCTRGSVHAPDPEVYTFWPNLARIFRNCQKLDIFGQFWTISGFSGFSVDQNRPNLTTFWPLFNSELHRGFKPYKNDVLVRNGVPHNLLNFMSKRVQKPPIFRSFLAKSQKWSKSGQKGPQNLPIFPPGFWGVKINCLARAGVI